MRVGNNILIFQLLLLSVCSLSVKNVKETSHFDENDSSSRMTQALTWKPIRILFDFSNVKTTSNVLTYLSNTVFATIQQRLQNIITINDSQNIGPFTATNCENLKVPLIFGTQTTSADLIIFIQLNASNDNTIALSSPCAFTNKKFRPTVGVITLNLNFLRWGADHVDSTISTCFHEVLHIMIISPSLYNNYATYKFNNTYFSTTMNSTTNTTIPVSVLGSVGLLSYAKNYFNCPSMQGVYLENQGGTSSVSSHWNKLLLGNELMTSQRTGFPAMSLFTYYLMSDSGWYQLDFSTADDINWGKYAGCDFVYTPCNPKFREFCSVPNQLSCSVDYRAKTICTQSIFTSGCYYNEYMPENICSNTVSFKYASVYEQPGANSRCFNVAVNGKLAGNCFQFVCGVSGISFSVQSSVYNCTTSEQQIIVNAQLTVTCPDINHFCNVYQNSKCPNDCNGQGTCSVAGICKCNYFYTGTSCETQIDCHQNDSSICSILKQTDLPLISKMMSASLVQIFVFFTVQLTQLLCFD